MTRMESPPFTLPSKQIWLSDAKSHSGRASRISTSCTPAGVRDDAGRIVMTTHTVWSLFIRQIYHTPDGVSRGFGVKNVTELGVAKCEGVRYDARMNPNEITTLTDALDDDIACQTLRDMMLATAIYDDRTLAYNDDDFDASAADDDEYALIDAAERALRPAYDALIADPDARDLLTHLALATSLCPLHLCDYAICFDDRTADCAMIRRIHPSHDT
jgi:hypothetical protein